MKTSFRFSCERARLASRELGGSCSHWSPLCGPRRRRMQLGFAHGPLPSRSLSLKSPGSWMPSSSRISVSLGAQISSSRCQSVEFETREPGHLEPEHDSGPAHADLGDQMPESLAIGVGAGQAEVGIDHDDALGRPARSHRPLAQCATGNARPATCGTSSRGRRHPSALPHPPRAGRPGPHLGDVSRPGAGVPRARRASGRVLRNRADLRHRDRPGRGGALLPLRRGDRLRGPPGAAPRGHLLDGARGPARCTEAQGDARPAPAFAREPVSGAAPRLPRRPGLPPREPVPARHRCPPRGVPNRQDAGRTPPPRHPLRRCAANTVSQVPDSAPPPAPSSPNRPGRILRTLTATTRISPDTPTPPRPRRSSGTLAT